MIFKKEKLYENIMLHKIEKVNEGIYYDEMIKDLVFDFDNDYDDDIIYLNNAALTDTTLDMNLYSYGYIMNKDAAYINKFMEILKNKFNTGQVTEEMQLFIDSATYWFDRDHQLNSKEQYVVESNNIFF